MLKKPMAFILAALVVMLTSCAQTPAKGSGSSSSVQSSSSVVKNVSAVSKTAVSSKVASSSTVATSSIVATTSTTKVHESSNAKVIRFYTEASKYYTKKDYTSAVNDCDRALAIDPLCYEAINIKGAAQYYATGDPQQGLPLINKCIQLNPKYQYGYFNKALIYKGEKNWSMSISLFNKVIELAPNNAWAYYGISTIYADRNMVALSLKYLKKAIEVDPSVKATARVQDHYDRMRSNKDFQALVK